MSVGILYIAIGQYSTFFEDFYRSCETHLFPNAEKNYYVFSDVLGSLEYQNVTYIKVSDLGWPNNTLMRFDMFLRHRKLWEHNDYMVFMNGNSLVLKDIPFYDFFPKGNETITVLTWHVYDKFTPEKLPYERNPDSTAYIPKGDGQYYFQGGLFGAPIEEFINLVVQCQQQITADLKNSIIAVHHDESHLNRYLLDKPVYILTTIYGRPEEWQYPENPKLIFRDKNRLLGKEYIDNLKQRNQKVFLHRLKKLLKCLIS